MAQEIINRIPVFVNKLRPDVELPQYAHGPLEDAGFDLRAAEDFTLESNKITVVPTGLAFQIPPGYEGQIRPRSGLAAKYGVTVVNSPGTIDPGYRGEVKVILTLLAPQGHYQMFKAGERIAQMVIAPYMGVELVDSSQLSSSLRGELGFGSTGT